MTPGDSALDRDRMTYARALLRTPEVRERAWPALAAAAAAALAALALAAAMITAPPVTTTHVVQRNL